MFLLLKLLISLAVYYGVYKVSKSYLTDEDIIAVSVGLGELEVCKIIGALAGLVAFIIL